MPLDTFLLLAIPAAVILAVLFWFLRKGSASEKAKARDQAQPMALGGEHPPAEPSSQAPPDRSAPTTNLTKAAAAVNEAPVSAKSAGARVAVPPSLVVPHEPASSDDVFVDDSAFDEPDQATDAAPLEALTEPLSDQEPTLPPPAAKLAPLSEDRTPIPGEAATPQPGEAAAPNSAETPPPISAASAKVAEPPAAVPTPTPSTASVPREPPSVPRVPPSMPRVPPLPAVPVAARAPLGSSPGVVEKPVAARAPLGSSPGVVEKPVARAPLGSSPAVVEKPVAARAPLGSSPAVAETPAARPALSSTPAVAETPAARPALGSTPGLDGTGAPNPPRALRNLRVTPTSELEKSDPRHQAARRFARLAVSEIVLYHEADVQAGRQAKDLWTRFKADIDLCLSTYDKRFPKEVRDKFDYLYDELVHQLAQGDPEKLGPHAPRPAVTPPV